MTRVTARVRGKVGLMTMVSDAGRLEAYEHVIHQLIGTMASIKNAAKRADELLEAGEPCDEQVTNILEMASGRLEKTREALR